MAETATAATPIKPKRAAQVRKVGPRPAYVLINLPEGVNADDIEIVGITRHAEEALEAIDTGKATKYLRVLVK